MASNRCLRWIQVRQSDLEVADGVVGKYTAGLGQEALSFCSDREDVVSLGRTVVTQLLEGYGVDPQDISRLTVGTETGVDRSKSVASHLLDIFTAAGNNHIQAVDHTHGCYGGTSALLSAVDWVAGPGWDGGLALVVAADVAVYPPGSAARPTGGCGAVALLVGPNASLVVEGHPWRSTHSAHTYDFYKPHGHPCYPLVDGPASLAWFTAAAEGCASRMLTQINKQQQQQEQEVMGPVQADAEHQQPPQQQQQQQPNGVPLPAQGHGIPGAAAGWVPDAAAVAAHHQMAMTAGAGWGPGRMVGVPLGMEHLVSPGWLAAQPTHPAPPPPAATTSSSEPAAAAGTGTTYAEGTRPGGLLSHFDYFISHAPFHKLVQKTFARLVLQDALRQAAGGATGAPSSTPAAATSSSPAGTAVAAQEAGVAQLQLCQGTTTTSSSSSHAVAPGSNHNSTTNGTAGSSSSVGPGSAAAATLAALVAALPADVAAAAAAEGWQPDQLSAASLNDSKQLQRSLVEWGVPAYSGMVAPAAALQQQLGNLYTASVWAGLAGLVGELGEGLAGRKVLLYSFGSGAVASMLVVRGRSSTEDQGRWTLARMQQKLEIPERLQQRIYKTPQEFNAAMDGVAAAYGAAPFDPKGPIEDLAPGTCYLASVDERFRRHYDRVPSRT